MNIFDVAETTIKLPFKELSLHQRFVKLSKARSVIGHSGTNKCQCRGLGLDITDYLLCRITFHLVVLLIQICLGLCQEPASVNVDLQCHMGIATFPT